MPLFIYPAISLRPWRPLRETLFITQKIDQL